ncbi:hypothetical protein M2272_005833 [Mycobacterium frederiksbergense]|uniref:Uncharacterized protein n=1 Tax=Mycolicibacterium frederiksbergense TaxID=117567 RepID=A0ABT6L9W3_9MYCO|nr:hypothetical protein [Mycolicibacterium frederiksbergense]MDH6199165.1 hypothetical protein [Mycolicibacterium frederiksbergense]
MNATTYATDIRIDETGDHLIIIGANNGHDIVINIDPTEEFNSYNRSLIRAGFVYVGDGLVERS